MLLFDARVPGKQTDSPFKSFLPDKRTTIAFRGSFSHRSFFEDEALPGAELTWVPANVIWALGFGDTSAAQSYSDDVRQERALRAKLLRECLLLVPARGFAGLPARLLRVHSQSCSFGLPSRQQLVPWNTPVPVAGRS